MSFGDKLRSFRESQGMSQKELANHMNVTTGVIAEWEADEDTPNLAELSHLCKVLNISSDTLLDDITDIVLPPKQESKMILTATNKPKKTGWIIGGVIFCAVLVMAAVLWSQGVFTPKSLSFAEDVAKIEAADSSVVPLFCYDCAGELAGTGSGFVAFDGKTIITNYHVMALAYTCKISTNQDISYEVSRILCYSEEQDIAILQLAQDTGLQPLTLGDSSIIKKGETVVAVGSPLGIKNTVSTGVLSGRLMEENMDVLQFTAPISSGSSGGALFDNNGNVIGITYASYKDGQNLNLAIPIEMAKTLYDSKGVAEKVSSIHEKEYPYVKELVKYNYIPEITVEELLENPEKYNHRDVKVYGYFSSFYSYWSDLQYGSVVPGEVYLLYITSEDNVTGNGELDNSTCEEAADGNIKHRILKVHLSDLDDDRFYLNEDMSPGDLICWIGEISYFEYSDGTTFIFSNTDLCFSVD